MSRRVFAFLVVLAVLAAVPCGATAATVVPRSAPAHANNSTAANGTAPSSGGFGPRLTGFMASSAAHANVSVGESFWEASYADARNRTRSALGRTRSLSHRYRALKTRRERLLSVRSSDRGAGRPVAARLRAVNASLDAVREAVSHTARTSRRFGRTPRALDELNQTVRADAARARGHGDGRENGNAASGPAGGADRGNATTSADDGAGQNQGDDGGGTGAGGDQRQGGVDSETTTQRSTGAHSRSSGRWNDSEAENRSHGRDYRSNWRSSPNGDDGRSWSRDAGPGTTANEGGRGWTPVGRAVGETPF